MPTLKENYEAINAILLQNEEIVKKINETTDNLELKIKEYEKICIPILREIKKPQIIRDNVYKMQETKCIVLNDCPKIDKESLQSLLDEISPIKLIVEKVEEREHLQGRAFSYKYEFLISIG